MRYRPKRENYAIGQFGEVDYQEMLERYCTYLENQNKQLRIGDVSQQRELLIAYNIDFYKGIHDVDLKHIEANVDKYLSKL